MPASLSRGAVARAHKLSAAYAPLTATASAQTLRATPSCRDHSTFKATAEDAVIATKSSHGDIQFSKRRWRRASSHGRALAPRRIETLSHLAIDAIISEANSRHAGLRAGEESARGLGGARATRAMQRPFSS